MRSGNFVLARIVPAVSVSVTAYMGSFACIMFAHRHVASSWFPKARTRFVEVRLGRAEERALPCPLSAPVVIPLSTSRFRPGCATPTSYGAS